MKYSQSIFVIIFASILFLSPISSVQAQESASQNAGGFFIEPGLTFEQGNWTATFPSPFNDATGITQGLGLQLKAGLHFADIFFGGLDIMASQPTFKSAPNNYESRATSTLIAAVVGAQFPVTGLRAWGGYVFRGDLDPDVANSLDVKFKDATGYKLGGGLKFQMVSLNVEYIVLGYSSTELQQLGPFASGSNLDSTKLKNNSLVFSVSFPFTL